MNSFLKYIVFDNSIQLYLLVLGVIILALFIKKLVSRYCAGLLYKMVGKVGNGITKQSFFSLVVQPLELFILLFVAFVSLDKLKFPSILDFNIFKISSKEIIDSISNGLLVVTFIWLCLRLIDFTAMVLERKADITKDVNDSQLIVFFKDFFKVIVVIMGVLLVLHFCFHRNIGNLLTGLSIVGAAIALATRESLENLIASFIIFFDKPFATGDTVKVLQFTGTVEKIGLRSTRIRTESKTYITVPNKQMVDSVVDNISLRTQRKVEIKLEINLKTTAQQLQLLMTEIKKKLAAKELIESYQIHLTETGKQAHIVTIECYSDVSNSLDSFTNLKEQINFDVLEIVEQMAIKFCDLGALTNK
ncbi:MAG: mechanosensitive ion channel family protein [Chitinophagaceae bacterium]